MIEAPIINRIKTEPFSTNCDVSGEMYVATYDPERYCNLGIKHGDKSIAACIKGSEAKQLRDDLLKFYPLENHGIPKPVYRTQQICVDYEVIREGYEFTEKAVALVRSKEEADLIADALNNRK